MKILITNDDGYDSPLIHALFEYCHERVSGAFSTMVAPKKNNSGISHAISISGNVACARAAECHYMVEGTPADCVNIACGLWGNPDIVISGPNIGSNLGQDVLYSGTVAAAREAAVRGIPALAFSMVDDGVHSLELLDKKKFFVFLDALLEPLMHLAREKKNKLISINIADLSTLQLYEGGLSMRHYYEYYTDDTIPEVGGSFQALQTPGLQKEAVAPKGTDWDLVSQGKNVCAIIEPWPVVEFGVREYLRKHDNSKQSSSDKK